MKTCCIIIARAGSKGLVDKNTTPVLGRPMIEWTLDHALAAAWAGVVDAVAVSTDGRKIADVARARNVTVIDRPAELATDTATVDAAVRHAVETLESQTDQTFDAVVILYANVPVRPDDLIGRSVAKLRETCCDSVQSLAPVGKAHPYWMKTLGGPGGDALEPYEANAVYRRPDLPPCYQLDGGIIAVRRAALFKAATDEQSDEPHAFLGGDRRAVTTEAHAVVDVDEAGDLVVAEAALRRQLRGPDELRIGAHRVGAARPVFVIAELGVNHDGDADRAIELTHAARRAGADAIKLQCFDPDHLLSAEAELARYQQQSADDPRQMLRRLGLGDAAMMQVRQVARELGLAFIVTPFGLEDRDRLARLDVDAVKIASSDCINRPLIDMAASLGRPLLISTGAAHLGEVVRAIRYAPRDRTALLQCVSSYPVPVGCAALRGINVLTDLFGGTVGYSDHTTGLLTGMLAVAAGACIIEKHLTHDTTAAGPDHAASLDPPALAKYIEHIRAGEAERGDLAKVVEACEADVRRVSRQSLCATGDLAAGSVLARANLTIKRPGTGLPAEWLDHVIGRTLKRDVKADHLLHEGDVDGF